MFIFSSQPLLQCLKHRRDLYVELQNSHHLGFVGFAFWNPS